MTGKEKNALSKARIAVSGKIKKPYIKGKLTPGPRAIARAKSKGA